MARQIEAAGFDGIWVGDHLLYDTPAGRKGPWEAFTQLAAVAAVTGRVEIGPLVAAQPFHEPAILAKQAATIDEISGGRLVLGLGAGWNRTEFAAFGLPFEGRVSRFEEGFEIIRRLLGGESVTHHGRFYDLDECVLLPPSQRPGGPGLMVGSNSPRMLSITLPHVAAWNTWYTGFDNDPDQLVSLMRTIDDACATVDRDPDTLEKSAAILIRLDGAQARPAEHALTGSTGELAAALTRFAETGIDGIQLVLDPIDERSVATMADVVERMR